MRRARLVSALMVLTLLGVWLASQEPSARAGPADRGAVSRAGSSPSLSGIQKIRHVVIIMQENRSFDNYFGTYPGADGIPGLAGNPGPLPCLPDPGEKCAKPFHDRQDYNDGGPHYSSDAFADLNGGKMDGFIARQEEALTDCKCGPSHPADDVMGYHTGKEIPNYWTYAHDFVLQDHMFEPSLSWSLLAHLYLVSLWSARCKVKGDPQSCTNTLDNPAFPPGWRGTKKPPNYAWTDLTYLLYKHQVSWRYYVFKGVEPDCESDAKLTCVPVTGGPQTASIWNPLPYFTTVQSDRQLHNIQSLNGFFTAARRGTLPAVSWIMPNHDVSEHPFGLLSKGQTYVTGLINLIMGSPEWNSTAIFLAWDDWSGFYDNAVPPRVDANGYGLRVPALVISPYARAGYIDHQTLSFDAYAKFIEDDFLASQRLDPATDGRPDPRPGVRENAPQLGNLVNDFNFNQAPLPPVLLPVHPKTDLIGP